MLGTSVRNARARGAPLLDADLQWLWPPSCVDHRWVPSSLQASYQTYLQRRAAAQHIQACVRRRMLPYTAPGCEDAFYLVPAYSTDEEWEVLPCKCTD